MSRLDLLNRASAGCVLDTVGKLLTMRVHQKSFCGFSTYGCGSYGFLITNHSKNKLKIKKMAKSWRSLGQGLRATLVYGKMFGLVFMIEHVIMFGVG
jgi:hypothetical protein